MRGSSTTKKTWQGSVHLCDRCEGQLKASRIRDYHEYQTRRDLIDEIVYDLYTRH